MYTRIVARFARLARVVCQHCGAPGTIYADDHETILCGRCWLLTHGEEPRP